MSNLPALEVDSYAGYKGEETPRAFVVEGVRVEVVDILERWYTDSYCCFRVSANDRWRYVLRCHLDERRWELVMRERPPVE